MRYNTVMFDRRLQHTWHQLGFIPKHRLPAGLQDWIYESGSLTSRLKQAFHGDVRVEVQSQHHGFPYADEADVMGIRQGEMVMVRQVILLGAEQPMIFARSVTPIRAYNGAWRRLKILGTRPLGDLLFTLPDLQRTVMEISQLPEMESIWARRSLYMRHHQPLLVMEAFMPDLYS